MAEIFYGSEDDIGIKYINGTEGNTIEEEVPISRLEDDGRFSIRITDSDVGRLRI